MSGDKNRVCPVELAGSLDNRIRRWLQNPRKILGPYIREGMTALDLGCGPGFFSIEMAHMVGETGRVIAADLQDGMLQKIKNKIRETEIEKRITLHRCGEDAIGVTLPVDFVLTFWMVHEVPNQKRFFEEIYSVLKPEGSYLIVEPKFFHVSKSAFAATIGKAEDAGFKPVEKPKILMSQSTLLRRD